jgi:O-antigen biosynthesis protein
VRNYSKRIWRTLRRRAVRLSIPLVLVPQWFRASKPFAQAARARALCAEEQILLQILDQKWYLEVNGDVAAAGVDALTHFISSGESEDRDPNPNFSIRYYRATYMQGEPPGASPSRHFIEHGRALGYDPNPRNAAAYSQLVSAHEQSYGLEIPELRRHIDVMVTQPLFIIYLDSKEDVVLERTRQALAAQIYDRLILCNDLNDVLTQASQSEAADWRLIWLDANDVLHSSALYCYASVINAIPSADVIYADEDEIDDQGHRRRPFFKPDWSPDYFESFNFLGTGTCVSGPVCAAALEGVSGAYDLLLRATEVARRVEHIRQVLIHRPAGLDQPRSPEQIEQDADALCLRLRRTGRSGTVTPLHPDRACYVTRLAPASTPLVSVVIPTAGKILDIGGRKVDLLFNCLDQFLGRTTYQNVEFIVIHNDDLGQARLSLLIARGIKVLAYRGEFNVARKLNIGAAASSGDFLLLLNDDVEPIAPDWIERMVEHFEKPHVGVVGAKLLFPTMQIQHAGIVMIDAKPDHLRFKYPRDDQGYFFSTCAVRNFSAVTGAVMMTRASLYRELGGYTEDLPINFNDVDYCLKVADAGYAIVYTPQAELIHYESMSRTRKVDAFEIEYFEKRWASFIRDRYYNQTMLKTREPDYEIVPSRSLVG